MPNFFVVYAVNIFHRVPNSESSLPIFSFAIFVSKRIHFDLGSPKNMIRPPPECAFVFAWLFDFLDTDLAHGGKLSESLDLMSDS